MRMMAPLGIHSGRPGPTASLMMNMPSCLPMHAVVALLGLLHAGQVASSSFLSKNAVP